MIKKTITIKNSKGIHAVFASKISHFVSGGRCEVFLKKDGKIANCRSPVSILMLFAKCGEEVELLVDGIEEERCIDEVYKFIENYMD